MSRKNSDIAMFVANVGNALTGVGLSRSSVNRILVTRLWTILDQIEEGKTPVETAIYITKVNVRKSIRAASLAISERRKV